MFTLRRVGGSALPGVPRPGPAVRFGLRPRRRRSLVAAARVARERDAAGSGSLARPLVERETGSLLGALHQLELRLDGADLRLGAERNNHRKFQTEKLTSAIRPWTRDGISMMGSFGVSLCEIV